MLTKPTEPLLKAIISLGSSGTFGEVIRFLDGEREKIRDLMETTPQGDALGRLQGRAQFATEFMQMLRDAATVLAKLKTAPPP